MDNKYVITPDTVIRQAGFSFKSKMDLEQDRIKKELLEYSTKSTDSTLLLTFFPIFGLHRLTNGKILSGLLFACTAGGLFIWWIYDMILIAGGRFTDRYGRFINSPKVTELEMELDALEHKFLAGKKVYEIRKNVQKELVQMEYEGICEELGYEK